MPNITALIEELERYGIPKGRAYSIAAELIVIGEKAAVYQRETANAVAELLVERRQCSDRVAQTISRNSADA